MRKIIQYKDKLTNEVSEKLQNSKSFIIFKYSGLTAQEITELRKKLLPSGSKVAIYKNNILQRALEKAKIKGFETLKGPNRRKMVASRNLVMGLVFVPNAPIRIIATIASVRLPSRIAEKAFW